MNRNDGRNVNHVTTVAASAPARKRCSGPKSCFAQPPTKPTKATTMINGPGVVSPSANPSIICGAVSRRELAASCAERSGSENDRRKRNRKGENRHERRRGDCPQRS